MGMRVLVPLDGSERAEAALAAVEELCDKDDEIMLLSIGDTTAPIQTGTRPGRLVRGAVMGPAGAVGSGVRPDQPVYGETRDQAIERVASELKDYLALKASPLRSAGYNVTTEVDVSDRPAQAIIDFARQHKPAYIMMMRQTKPGIGERLFGTVAQQVIRADVAPVMILPHR